ncbi:MAG: TetR/AcrR family transcriptional regulator [Acidimicrobiales bacterium]
MVELTAAPVTTPLERHRGRPRNEDCDRAIESAALELLVEDGFGKLTMEGVASRAGVGKATVYRRWDTKEALVVHAVHARCVDDAHAPSTGSARGDLTEMIRQFLYRAQRQGTVMQAFAAEQGRHPELAETFRTTFLAGKRAATQEVVRRGVASGELPADTDVELVGDVGAALLWHRLTVTGEPLDDDLPERIVAQFLPARAAPSGR